MNRKPKQKTQNPKQEIKTYEKTVDLLCARIGISRETFFNYRNEIGVPKKTKKGYCLEDWQEFFTNAGLGTMAKIQKAGSGKSLKDQLTERDIILRDLLIDERKGKLIPKELHESLLLSLTTLYKQSLNQIPLQIQAAFPENKAIQSKAQSIIDGIMSRIIQNLETITWEKNTQPEQ